MTFFNILGGNLPRETRESLTDVFRWITSGLEENGHQVFHHHQHLISEGYNIVVDYVDNDDAIEAIRKSGARWIVVSTEVPDGNGSFWGLDDDVWKARYRRADALMKGASAVWAMTNHPSHLAWGARHAPTSFLGLGFTEQLHMSPMPAEPYYDVLFCGSANDRRIEVLNKLIQRGAKVRYPGHLVSWFEKEAAIHSSAMSLDLRLFPGMEVPSYARIGRSLNAGRVIVQEWAPQRAPLSHLAPMCGEGEDFTEFVMGFLRQDLRKMGIEMMERYEAEMKMRDCMAVALDETLMEMAA